MSRAGLFGAVSLVFAWLSTIAPASSAADGMAPPPGRTSFRIYGADDGLSNLVTRHLAQDRLRFVWVGTDDGLFRYDGERFVRFGLDEGLPSTRVTGLLAAPDGRLWMASRNGLAFFDETDITKPPPRRLTTVMADRGPSGVILCMAAEAPSDRDGPSRLWVGTSDGLFREDIAGSARFVAVSVVGNAEVSALWIDADHKVLMGRGNKLAALNTSGALDEPTKTLTNRIDTIVRDRLGRLWLRTPDGLYVQRAPGQPFVDESAKLPAISTNGYLALDRKGDVWAMTNRGLLHIDGDRYEKMPRGLATEWSWSFLEDHEGSRWIGSTGLNRELGRGLWRVYGAPEGFASEIIWELARDRDGSMLIATDEGVARLTSTGAQRIAGTERYTIRAITLAPDGSYYAAGSPAEILHIQPSGKIDKLGAAQGLRGKTVMAMYLDGERRLWIGTDGGGLQRMDTTAAKPTIESVALPGGTDRELINDLRADATGRLWVAGENGLALVAGEHQQRFTLGDGLRATGINTVLHRKDGEICISYFDSIGLSCFRESDGKLTGLRHRDVERGLSSNRVYSIGEDARGRLWVTSGAGADVITGEALEHFGKSDGMPGDDCDSRSFLADPDGGVWIGTSTGLGHFDGARYEGPIAAPQTTVIAASAGARPLRALPLQLGPTERTLALYIAGSSYTHERRTSFESRLVGLDDDWTMSTTRELRFPGLAPGRYLFEVRSRVDRGAWGEIAAWPVVVDPAWWQTWIARAAGGMLVVALFALAIGWRLRRLRLRNEQLQTLVEARTAELKIANQALTDQTLTDPLTGLRNRRYLTSTLPTDVAQVQRTYRDLTNGRVERLPRNVDLVFLMVDLDHFKQVNDQYGHGAGDRVLQELRGVLIQACRTSDIVVRWGGEEFLIVARNSSRDEATILAERVRAAIAAQTFDLGGGQTLRRTCSVGFAAFPLVPSAPDAASWEEVIDLADRCLFLAKREGRDRWVGVRATDALVVSDERSWLHQQFDGLVTRGDLELQRSEPKAERREPKSERREPEPV